MKALIILAHGSRRDESNLEISDLTNKVKMLESEKFDFVEYAFLEMATPSLMDSIENLIDNNVSEIIVFPFFLNSGVLI